MCSFTHSFPKGTPGTVWWINGPLGMEEFPTHIL